MRCVHHAVLRLCLLLLAFVPISSWINIVSPTGNEQFEQDETVVFAAELDRDGSNFDAVQILLDGLLLHTWSRHAITQNNDILTLILEDVPVGKHSLRVLSADAGGDSEHAVNFSKVDKAASGDLRAGYLQHKGSPSVRILSPAVNEVLEYREEGGALLNVEVQCLDFAAGGELGGKGGVMVVLLNGQEMYRAPSTSAAFQVGGLHPGPHLLSVALLGDGGTEVVRGSLGKGGGQLMGSPEAEAAADCFAPFKVDTRVWALARSTAESVMRKALHPAPDPPPSSHPRPDAQPDAPPSAAAGAGGGARLELGEAFSWEDVREAYARFHAAALAGAPGSVGLYVYTPRDCGWGNRLIDLASAYQVALLTERVLVLNWTAPVPLWLLAESPLEAWPHSPGVAEHLAAARSQSYLLLDLDSLSVPHSLSQILAGYKVVEYHVGPVIRALYDDGVLGESKAMGLMHPELGIALGAALNAVPLLSFPSLLLPSLPLFLHPAPPSASLACVVVLSARLREGKAAVPRQLGTREDVEQHHVLTLLLADSPPPPGHPACPAAPAHDPGALPRCSSSPLRLTLLLLFASPPPLPPLAAERNAAMVTGGGRGQERLGASGYRIGVHARVTMSRSASAGGDSQIGPSSTIPLRRQGQAMLLAATLSRLASAPNRSHVVLATDSADLRRSFAQHPLIKGRILATEGEIVHSARERGLSAQAEMAVDWWSLASCHELILTRQSTFGYIAAGAAGVVPLTVHEHKVERRFHCGPFALCDLHPAESGV